MKKAIRIVTLPLILLVFIHTSAYADAKSFYNERYLAKLANSDWEVAQHLIQEKTYQQLIDHSNVQLGTFTQRYYVDESFSTSKDSPVFYYICGESECTQRSLTGAVRTLAQKYHAKLIALEHRYYGKSLPFAKLSTDNLKYLTTESALQDLAQFQKDMSIQNQWTGKWIAFGASYPGSLAAYYRMKYPQLVSGALASSAPVMAKEDFEEYDAHVTKVLGKECADKVRSVIHEVEEVVRHNQKDRIDQYKKLFEAEDIKDNRDFLYALADMVAAVVQYGRVYELCDVMAEKQNPLDAYVSFAKFEYALLDMRAIDLVPEGSLNEDSNKNSSSNMRQWLYQSCSEYGYWQNANHDPEKSSRSSLLNLDYSRNVCTRLFNIQASNGDYINDNFYAPLLNYSVSHIFFTNGSTDPWSNLSLTTKNGNATNPYLDYYTIEGAAHADDLSAVKVSDSATLREARQKLDGLIKQWLAK